MISDKLIEVAGVLVHEDIFKEEFICNLTQCRGACCIEGDSGAPLLDSELSILKDIFPQVEPYLSDKGRATIAQDGEYIKDFEGDYTTTCIDKNKECAYVIFQDGIAKCAIEQAYEDKKIEWQKPISCHLYPIRITYYPTFDVLYYDRWNICSDACMLGKKEKVAVFQFLKNPLIRKYGESWYNELVEQAELIKNID